MITTLNTLCLENIMVLLARRGDSACTQVFLVGYMSIYSNMLMFEFKGL